MSRCLTCKYFIKKPSKMHELHGLSSINDCVCQYEERIVWIGSDESKMVDPFWCPLADEFQFDKE